MRPIGLRAGSAIDPDTLDACGRVTVPTGRAAGGELDGRPPGGELAGFCDCGRTSEPGGGVEIGADIGAERGGIDGGA